MHLKRNKIEKFWPIPRKGTKFLARPLHAKKDSIPLIVVMRDVLKLVRNKKELKKLLNEKAIKINHKEIRDVNYPICLLDVLILEKSKKNYRTVLSKNKKLIFKEITDKEAESKVFKIVGKKILANKKVQLNLMHGRNILSKEKANIGDSVVIDLRNNKVLKVFPLEEGRMAFITKGRHSGQEGKIEEIIERGGKKLAKIGSEKEKINVWIKNIIIVK